MVKCTGKPRCAHLGAFHVKLDRLLGDTLFAVDPIAIRIIHDHVNCCRIAHLSVQVCDLSRQNACCLPALLIQAVPRHRSHDRDMLENMLSTTNDLLINATHHKANVYCDHRVHSVRVCVVETAMDIYSFPMHGPLGIRHIG